MQCAPVDGRACHAQRGELGEEVVMAEHYVRLRPDRRDFAARERLLSRVRAEFLEMPCLRLTRAQAQRLFGLRPDICERVLAELEREHAIVRGSDDRYGGASDTNLGGTRRADDQ
jgi:hypothetical protein